MYMLAPAAAKHIPAVMCILDEGRLFQREQGFLQWPEGYPSEEIVQQDINAGTGFLLYGNGEIAAYLSLGFAGDPAYSHIVGKWRFEEPYAVIHRMATARAFRGKGAADAAFILAERICLAKGVTCLRIDTHSQNERMRHVLAKNGFVLCGTIMSYGERLAFDKHIIQSP